MMTKIIVGAGFILTALVLVFTCSWEKETSGISFTYQSTIGSGGRHFVAFSKYKDLIATFSDEYDVCIFDYQTGMLVKTVSGPLPQLGTGIFGQSKYFAFIGKGKTVGIINLDTWNIFTKDIDGEISVLTFAHDDRLICAGTCDGRIIIWDHNANSNPEILNAHSGIIWSVACEKSVLVSGGEDGVINIWNLATRKKQHSIKLGRPVSNLRFSLDGGSLIVISGDDNIHLFETANWTERWNVRPQRYVLAACFAGQKDYILSLGIDKSIRVLRFNDGREIYRLNLKGSYPKRMDVSENGNVAVLFINGPVELWKAVLP